MQGFVPVAKENLIEMIEECREYAVNEHSNEENSLIESYIKSEKVRSTTRKWYRLFILPNPRFEFTEAGVKKYAKEYDYPMFEANPFISLNADLEHSLLWLNRLLIVARSTRAGEPITLAMKDFMRLNDPARHYWAQARCWYRSIST